MLLVSLQPLMKLTASGSQQGVWITVCNLVVKDELFNWQNVKNLIEKCRRINMHAAHLNQFYVNFFNSKILSVLDLGIFNSRMMLKLAGILPSTCLIVSFNTSNLSLQLSLSIPRML